MCNVQTILVHTSLLQRLFGHMFLTSSGKVLLLSFHMQHTAIVMGRPAAECLRAIGVAAGSMPPVCRALLVLATGSVVGVMCRLSCHDGILFQHFFAMCAMCY